MSEKFHALLAVVPDLENRAKTTLASVLNSFTKRLELFQGYQKSLKMFSVDGSGNEAAIQAVEASGSEFHEVSLTVTEALKNLESDVSNFYKVLAQKEVTNQLATADVLLPDGKMLIEKAPATLLLALESKLDKLREVYQSIPVLKTGTSWVKEDTQREGVFRAMNPEVRIKTENKKRFQETSKATDRHPAQVAAWDENVPVGEFTTQHWSSMLPVHKKTQILDRIDVLIQAVKKARMRANNVDVPEFPDVGKAIFGYLNS